MNIIPTPIGGVWIIEPRIFGDARGYFFESYNQKEFDEKIGPIGLCRTTSPSRLTECCADFIFRSLRSPNRSW